MKKKLLIATMALAAVIGSTPMTSYAAQMKIVQVYPGEGYRMISGEDDECVQQILGQLDQILNRVGNYSPSVPSLPDCNVPETPQPEEAEQEEAVIPETPQPEEPQEEPVIPESPQPEEAEQEEAVIPEMPQPEEAEQEEPVIPETPKPAEPQPTEAPKPDQNGSDAADLSVAEQITALVNAERAKEGLPAVELNADITAAANVRAQEIRRQFAHTRPDGRNFSTVLTDRGITYWGCGENIAYGQRTPEEVMTGWMNSSGHRANIMNRNFKKIGVGYYQDERGIKYWVQLFTY